MTMRVLSHLRRGVSALATGITGGALVFTGGAYAQTSGDATDGASTYELEEIVVTAQKREQSLADVPIAVTALTADALEARGIDSISDLQFFVPTLQVTNFQAVSFVAIRGIGMENTTSGGDPGVTLHLDGVYLGRPVASFFDQFDIERMEVLRGPQGTLYGRNATGGSINVIPKKPGDELEAYADFTYGKFDRKRARGILNLPLGEGLATRATVTYEKRDGFQKNLFPGGTRANDADNVYLRGQVRADLGESADFLLAVNFSDVSGVGPTPEVRNPFLRIPSPSPVPLRPSMNAVNDLKPHLVTKDTPEHIDMGFFNLAGTLTWDLGATTFKSITSFGHTEYNSLSDSDGSGEFASALQIVEDTDQLSQELQLASNDGGDWEWIVGAFYFHESSERFSFFFDPKILNNFAKSPLAAPFSMSPRIQRFKPLFDPGFIAGGDVTADSVALFGQASYDLTAELRLTGGVRVTYDEKRSKSILVVSPLVPGGGPPTIADVPAKGNWLQPTGKFVVQWFPTGGDTNFYASYSRGYKSGGINLQAPQRPVIDPEKINAAEIGLKSRLSRTFQLDLSAFRYGITDLQVQTFGLFGAIIENAADATIKGIELEWRAAPAPGLDLNGSLSWLDATYDNFFNADPFVDITKPIDLSGKRLNRAPKWTVSGGAQYTFALADGAGDLSLRADVYYQSATFFRPFNLPSDRADNYANLDLRLFYTSPDETVTAEVYATNVTDATQESDILRSPPFLGPTEFVSYRPPRQYGIRLGLRY